MNNIVERDAIEFMSKLEKKPKLILTDPPYGQNYSTNIPGDKRWNKTPNKNSKFEVLKNDENLDSIDFEAFFKLCYDKSETDATMFCFCNDKAMVDWVPYAIRAGYNWKDTIVWNKKCANGGDIGWPFINVIEFILAFTKGKPKYYPLYNPEFELKKRVVNVLKFEIPNLINAGRTPKAEHCGHPTQKPLYLCEQLIRTSTTNDEYVVDPFCGSGSSLLAAKMLGRTFDGCDLDGDFVRIANERVDGFVPPIL